MQSETTAWPPRCSTTRRWFTISGCGLLAIAALAEENISAALLDRHSIVISLLFVMSSSNSSSDGSGPTVKLNSGHSIPLIGFGTWVSASPVPLGTASLFHCRSSRCCSRFCAAMKGRR
jgi:hypothetical protein